MTEGCSDTGMKSRCPTLSPPSRPRMEVHVLDSICPVSEGSRAPLLRSWLQLSHSDLRAHSSHILHSSWSLLWESTSREPCPPRRTPLLVSGVESLLRLKSHPDAQLRPHLWWCCGHESTPDSGRIIVLTLLSSWGLSPRPDSACSPCKELSLPRPHPPREPLSAFLSCGHS